MAQLKIIIKGKKDIYLTRNYNSLGTFEQNKDNIAFNDTVNDFSSWCLSSSCGNAAVDKVKILSLPSKGRLFYLTNPGNPNPVYANVTIGQEILVSDLVYNKVLKFSAEGSADNQFTENYVVPFTLERYCDSTGNNETVFVYLNMLDQMATPATFTETLRNDQSGFCLPSILEFEVSGDLTDYPVKIRCISSPSGANYSLVKLGTGTGIFNTATTQVEFIGDTQPKDGTSNKLSELDLLLTNSGTTKFRLTILSSDTAKNSMQRIVLLHCSAVEGDIEIVTSASIDLIPLDTIPQNLSIENMQNMYYSESNNA